jgi:2-methylcitrate dehydratase
MIINSYGVLVTKIRRTAGEKMTSVEELAAFVKRATYDALSERARQQLKIRILDALGCAIGALGGEPIHLIKAQIDDFGDTGKCTLIGGERSAPDRATLYNSALVRYLDFNDSYLSKNETCHPSDNLGAVLAAAEYAGGTGRELMAALAVAYQVQCRLSDVAPVRARGFDHTVQGSYAVSAAVSKALRLDEIRTAHAIAISGTAFNALRVTRTGALSHWKGLAYPNTAFGSTHAAFLAMRGVTGPLEVFEGNKGFMDTISGKFYQDWSLENLEKVTGTIVKKFNAEIHSQAAIEGILELKQENGFKPGDVERVEIEIFDVAYDIIGGGEEGDKTLIRTKEEADHSLPYLIAVAVLDGQVMPEQYRPERITRQDVQHLLRNVKVRPLEAYSRRFPEEMPCRLTVTLRQGRPLIKEKRDYEGFHTRPMGWETVIKKFERLSAPYADPALRQKIIDSVARMEDIRVSDLMELLGRVDSGK